MVVFDSYPSPSINCSLVMVVFDSYPSPSIKDITSEARMATRANNKPRIFAISDETNIERVTMGELLANKDTKMFITTYFMKTLEEHLKSRYVGFVIAGNSITRVSICPAVTEKKNNHMEGDTLIIAAIEEASNSLTERIYLYIFRTRMYFFFLLIIAIGSNAKIYTSN